MIFLRVLNEAFIRAETYSNLLVQINRHIMVFSPLFASFMEHLLSLHWQQLPSRPLLLLPLPLVEVDVGRK